MTRYGIIDEDSTNGGDQPLTTSDDFARVVGRNYTRWSRATSQVIKARHLGVFVGFEDGPKKRQGRNLCCWAERRLWDVPKG